MASNGMSTFIAYGAQPRGWSPKLFAKEDFATSVELWSLPHPEAIGNGAGY